MFRGQITNEVTSHLLQNSIYFVTVPNNMTHLFQPLDLTVNGHCKRTSLQNGIWNRLITPYRLEGWNKIGRHQHRVPFIINQAIVW